MKILVCLAGDGIHKELVSEEDVGPYLIRKEIWSFPGDRSADTPMESAYTKDGAYIGNADTAKRLYEKYGIIPEVSKPNHNVCSIGKSETTGKWYGWSHRAIYGFKIGDSVKMGDCAYTQERGAWTAKTEDDAKQMAIDFAESVSSASSPVTIRQRRPQRIVVKI